MGKTVVASARSGSKIRPSIRRQSCTHIPIGSFLGRQLLSLLLLLSYGNGYLNNMSDNTSRFDAAVTAMTLPENRFDVTIICTTDDHQAEFWMSKLNMAVEGEQFPLVLAVSEDWGGSGAGNGLGTLYAWKKACAFAQAKYQLDLVSLLGEGKISASLYHTAGKGTRMAPLPASENNNKPGVVRPHCEIVGTGGFAWD